MALADAKRLYDISIRLQIYSEAVKLNQSAEFDSVLIEVRKEFDKILGRIKYTTLDGLTKRELNLLLASLKDSQTKVYSRYYQKVADQLNEFMHASLTVHRIVYATTAFNLPNDKIPTDKEASIMLQKEKQFAPLFGVGALIVGNNRLWSSIVNEPIAANGVLPLNFIKSFSASAKVSVENLFRKAYSNGLTKDEAREEVAKQIGTLLHQADAVMTTSLAHVESLVSAAVASAIYEKYKWISVIDKGTTTICRSRNNVAFIYGRGPLPPAHMRCRSGTMPDVGVFTEKTFYAWIKDQNAHIQNFALGAKNGAALRAGKLNSADVAGLTDQLPLTIAQYAKSANSIITGEK